MTFTEYCVSRQSVSALDVARSQGQGIQIKESRIKESKGHRGQFAVDQMIFWRECLVPRGTLDGDLMALICRTS